MLIAILIQILFIAVNIGMAKWEAVLKSNALYVIKHGWWITIYFGLIVPAFFFDHDNYWLIILLILVRGVVFDPAFNIFRGFGITYQSLTTTSIVDKIEKFIFRGDFFFEKITYLALLITANLLLFTHVLK